jgi:predicted nucleic acid-binding protein
MTKAYIDSDIILDVLSDRGEHKHNSLRILSLCESGVIEGYTTPLAIANINYILRKQNPELRLLKIKTILSILKLMDITESDVIRSLNSNFSDFEDGIQSFAATRNNCQFIISRNIKDFKSSPIQALTPIEFLGQAKIQD